MIFRKGSGTRKQNTSMRSSIWNYFKLLQTSNTCFFPQITYSSSEWTSSFECEVPDTLRVKTVCAIGRLGRVGYFLSAWEAVPLPASKAAESATLPVISFPRLSPPLKIKPVSQIISQANQQSLCIWGWEEKLAIKGSMRNSVGKESCSLFYFSTSAYTLSPCGEPFPPELIFYLGIIPATNNTVTWVLLAYHNRTTTL